MSQTPNLNLFKHDNPSTNTNPFDIETSLNEDWDKIDTVVGEIQEEQTKQNKDIQSLQEDNAKLKAQIPTGQASGEEISLQDSAEMELADFSLQGNSEQERREGYNLANYNTKADSTKLNFQVGDVTNGKTYTLYLYIPTGTTSFNLRYNTAGGTTILTDYNRTGEVIKTFTAVEDAILYFNGFTPSEDYAGIEEIMLLEGTYTTENLPTFEEYGASPSLNYPSEVKAVGDNENIEIITSNKNLLNLDYRNANGIAFDKNRITVVNPTSYNNGIDSKLIKNKLLCGKNISVKIISNGSVVSGYVPSLVISTNKNAYRFQKVYYVNDYNNEVTNITRQFSEDEYISGIQFYTNYSQGGTKCNLAIDVQVEIADEATDFVEHQGNTCTLPIQKTMLNGDYIDLENKKEVHTYTKKVVSNTSEFNVNKNNNDKTFQFTVGITNPIQNAKVICNMFKFSPNTWNNTGCQISGNLFYGIVKFGDFGFTEDLTIEQAKQKFGEIIAETNLVFYYKTTTPEELDLTEEQAQVLEQIIEDGTYKGVTHFYTEEEVKPTLELKYYRDLETIINKQEQMQATLNNVQAQILELGGN